MAMKRILFTLSAIAALVCSCTKELGEQNFVEQSATIAVEVTPVDARTYVDGTAIRWAETGESLSIISFADQNTSRSMTMTDPDYKVTDNRALFTASIRKTDGASQYTLGAFYPYTYKSTLSSVTLAVNQEQNSTADSFDPATDILVSVNPVVTTTYPDKVSFQFARMVAFAKMTITGIEAGEKIQSVVFSSPAKPAGSVVFQVHESNTVETAVWYNNYEDITIKANNRVATGADTFWFTAVPTDLSGKEFTVTVITENNKYAKTVDLTGKTLNLERADVAVFTVKDVQKQEKPVVYKLLTDVTKLTAGDKVIFSTKKVESTTSKLLSTVEDGSALKFTDYVTISAALEIEAGSLPNNSGVFTVEAGATEGTLSFKEDTKGYLFGTYDSDAMAPDLSFKATKDAEASWTVELMESYAAKVYNPTHSRYLNNYYDSKFNFAGSQGTYYYYIYYIDGAVEAPETPETPETPVVTQLETPVVTATAEANTITVSWNAVAGAANYTVTCGTETQTVTTTSAVFADLNYEATYAISVIANPADSSVNSASEEALATVTTGTQPSTGSEAQTLTISFPADMPEGAASGNTVGTVYDGDILISSTGSWRTNKSDGRDCIYIGRATSGEFRVEAKNGKVITKVTLTAPVGYLVDLKAKEFDGYSTTTFASTTTAEWTGECHSKIVYTAVGSSHSNIQTITVEYK